MANNFPSELTDKREYAHPFQGGRKVGASHHNDSVHKPSAPSGCSTTWDSQNQT